MTSRLRVDTDLGQKYETLAEAQKKEYNEKMDEIKALES
jgi:hypothetical protein